MKRLIRKTNGKVRSFLNTIQNKLKVVASIAASLSVIFGLLWAYGPQVKDWYDHRIIAASAMEKVPERVTVVEKKLDRVEAKVDTVLDLLRTGSDAARLTALSKRFRPELMQ